MANPQIIQLSQNDFEMIDFTNLGVVQEDVTTVPRFVKGDTYKLGSIVCDGFEIEPDFYKLIGVINEYHNTIIDSVIVKKLHDTDNDRIYTLSKNDCKCLNIDYEKGLQLFPKKMNWIRYKEQIEFNSNDLSTVPLSDVDHTVRKVLLKINGFSNYDGQYIVTPNNDLILSSDLSNAFIVENLIPLSFTDTFSLIKQKLFSKIVYPKGVRFPYNNCISYDNSIYLLVSFTTAAITSFDGKCGVPKKYLENISPYDMFSISWYNEKPLSIEQYEKQKEQEKLALEKKKKEEQERKILAEKKQRERLKKEREKRKLIFEALQNDVWDISIDCTQWDNAKHIDEIDKEINKYITNIDNAVNTVTKTVEEICTIINKW